jgi:hypothetical protein
MVNLPPTLSGDGAMQASERLGTLGPAAVGLLALAVVIALTFGFAQVFYIALALVPVALVVMVLLCADRPERIT